MSEKHLYIVFGNPASPEQDAEFNEWYEGTHIPDVLTAVPGVVSAQRFKHRQLDRDAGKPVRYSYVTVYEIEGDPNEVMGAIGGGVASGEIRMDGAPFDPAKVNMAFWTPISEKVEKPE
jgi:hypothetical protein